MLCPKSLFAFLSKSRPPLRHITRQRPLKTVCRRLDQSAFSSTSIKQNGQPQVLSTPANEEEPIAGVHSKQFKHITSERLAEIEFLERRASEYTSAKSRKRIDKTPTKSSTTNEFTDFYLPEEPGDPKYLPTNSLDKDLVYHVPNIAAKPKLEAFFVSAEDDPPLSELDPEELAPETSQDPESYKDFFMPLEHPVTLPPPDIFPLPTREQALSSMDKEWWVPPPQPPYRNNGKHFSYVHQRIPGGKRVLSTYTTSLDRAEALVAQLRGKVYGLDLEWKPNTKGRVDVVQVCDENQVLILHVCHMEEFPPRLKNLLEDPEKIKVGVAIKADCTRLRNTWKVNCVSVVELGTFAQAVDHERWAALGITRKLIGLERLVHMYLDKPLLKGLGASMNWTKRNLSVAAKAYAANDCYSSWKVFQMLEAIRQKQDGVEIPIEQESVYAGTKEERKAARLREITDT